MFKEIKIERSIAGKVYYLSTGKFARQAGGSVMMKVGAVNVLATATMSKRQTQTDFFPLTVQYSEKYYAYGKIPGSYFKREAKLSDTEVLVSRMTDRPLRPLFPEGFFNEVQVISTVMSMDGVNTQDIMGMNAASAALCISDIPFHGPVGAVRIAHGEGQFIVNPTYKEIENSEMDLIVAGTKKAITMIEGDCSELKEEKVLEAVELAHEAIKEFISFQEELQKKAGKEKAEVELYKNDEVLDTELRASYYKSIEKAIASKDKVQRELEVGKIYEIAKNAYVEKEFNEDQLKMVSTILHDYEKEVVRKDILDNENRSDSRKLDELRQIECEIDILSSTHGSALFTRGETQSVGVVTLSSLKNALNLEEVVGENKKPFFLHYNFPPFSVGEVGRLGPPGRREVGHGMLAERALSRVFPNADEYPFAVRAVSEILESNGSSSMASICSNSMALMASGVPIKAMVAGIAMGLIMEKDQYKILTDIQGLEDNLGDMDFKVAGTREGITGFQLDIKVEGITIEIMKKALLQAKKARLEILDKMEAVISSPRLGDNPNAPIMEEISIPEDKVRVLIGPNGKNIKSIIEKTGSEVDVTDNGKVKVYAKDQSKLDYTLKMIDESLGMPKVGAIYDGRVKKITDFGAFVEIFSGVDGLLHISEISGERVSRVSDYFSEGDDFKVKVIGVDDRGRISLSKKQV